MSYHYSPLIFSGVALVSVLGVSVLGVSVLGVSVLGVSVLGCGHSPKSDVPVQVSSQPVGEEKEESAVPPKVELPSTRATVLARCRSVRVSGKRHNSFWFSFDVVAVLDGSFEPKTVELGEYYHDFGGGQLMRRLSVVAPKGGTGPGWVSSTCENEVVLRLAPGEELHGASIPASPGSFTPILWSALEAERVRAEQLEVFFWKFQQALTDESWSAMTAILETPAAYSEERFTALASKRNNETPSRVVGVEGMLTYTPGSEVSNTVPARIYLQELRSILSLKYSENSWTISSIDEA